MAEGDFNSRFQQFKTVQLQKADQELQEFKLKYTRWSANERAKFREVMTKASALSDELQSVCSFMTVSVETFEQFIDHDKEEIVYEGFGRLHPNNILDALDAWDGGKEFTPEGMY